MNQILKKSHDKSFIKRFHVTSRYAEQIFKEGSNKVVLQVMELEDRELIAEIIDRADYHE